MPNAIRYEVGSPLERLWADYPRLAHVLVERANYAKAVMLYLRAVDLFCNRTGTRHSRLRVETTQDSGKIVQRLGAR